MKFAKVLTHPQIHKISVWIHFIGKNDSWTPDEIDINLYRKMDSLDINRIVCGWTFNVSCVCY